MWSQGALFRHLATKADLLGAVIEDLYPDLVGEYVGAIGAELRLAGAAADPAVTGRRVMTQLLAAMARPETRAALELIGAARTDADLAARLAPVEDARRAALRAHAADLLAALAHPTGGPGLTSEGWAMSRRPASPATSATNGSPLYERTNGIQAMDLLGRKLPMDGGAFVKGYLAEMRELAGTLEDEAYGQMGTQLGRALDSVRIAMTWLTTDRTDFAASFGGATPFLRMPATTVGGYLLAVGARSGQGQDRRRRRRPVLRRQAGHDALLHLEHPAHRQRDARLGDRRRRRPLRHRRGPAAERLRCRRQAADHGTGTAGRPVRMGVRLHHLMRRRSSLLLIVVAVMVVTITPGTAGPHDESSRGSAPEMSIRPLDEDGVTVPERYADDHDEVYYRLTGQTAGFVVAADAENIGVVAHLDVIAGPGRGQRVDCVRTGESEGECDSQLRLVDAPGSVPTNPFNLFYWREEVPGTSEVVLWADRNGNGIREDAEIEDTARVEWLSPLSHLTLGDSYTSGTGIQAAYQPLPYEQCLRSTLAYGWQIRRRAPDGQELQAATGATEGADFRYFPCSGARVQNVLDVPFRGAPPQLEEALLSEVDPFAELVTMTVGGNDLRFADILLHCLRNVDLPVVPDDERFCFHQPLEDRDSTTLPTLAETFPDLLEDLRLLLSNLYAELRVRAPNAVIVQAGYPLVIDPGTTDCYGIAPEEVNWIVDANRAANRVIREQVEANGGIYADAEATFLGHGACTAEPWVRGISTWGITNPGGPTEHSFHPNALGHRLGYAAAFNAAIDAARQTYGVQENGLPNRIARFATDQPNATPGIDLVTVGPDGVVEAQLAAGQEVCTVGGLPPDTGFIVSADVFAPGSAVTVRGTTGTGGGFGPLELTADGTGAVVVDRTTGADGVFVVEFAGTSGAGSPVTAATQGEIVAEPCDDGAPSVSISFPADGAVFAAGEEIPISYDCGAALVCDGTLPIGTRTRAAGAYELRVTAISDEGVATTEEVSFSVGTPLRTTVRAVPDQPGQFEVVVEREAADGGARASVATTLTAAGGRSIVTTFNLDAGQSDARTVVELPVREPAALGVSSRSPQGWAQTTMVVPSSPAIPVDRLQGSSRYATAAAAAAAAYPQGASTALLARADDPADAFAASTLSLAAGAPVLLTDWDRLNEETRAALQDLDVDEIVLLGGTAAISPAVEVALATEWSVERVAGAERTETAALISALSQQALGTGLTAIVVPARRWEPALAATGLARAVSGPILLAEDAGLSEATREYLGSSTIERVIAVDPTGSTAAELSTMGLDVDVLTADSVTELSTVLAAETHAADPQARTYLVATTGTFADALAAGGLVSPLSASVLLVDDGSIVDEWVRSTDFVDRLIVMGGPAAVSEETVSRIRGDG